MYETFSMALASTRQVCAKAVSRARFPRIHTFIATSDIHMQHKLKKTREQVTICSGVCS